MLNFLPVNEPANTVLVNPNNITYIQQHPDGTYTVKTCDGTDLGCLLNQETYETLKDYLCGHAWIRFKERKED